MPVTCTLPCLPVGVHVVLLELSLVAALGWAAGETLLEGLGRDNGEEGEDEGGDDLHCVCVCSRRKRGEEVRSW